MLFFIIEPKQNERERRELLRRHYSYVHSFRKRNLFPCMHTSALTRDTEREWEKNRLFNIYLLQLQLVNREREASRQARSENTNSRRSRQFDSSEHQQQLQWWRFHQSFAIDLVEGEWWKQVFFFSFVVVACSCVSFIVFITFMDRVLMIKRTSFSLSTVKCR